MKKEKRSRLFIFVSPLITLIIMLLIYSIKGIYPFGTGNVQGGDLYQLYLPNFFHTIDAFKNGSVVYDFTTAAGIARNELLTLAQPTSWFVLLFSKERLADALSYLVIIKFCVISLCASYSFSKIFYKLSALWIILLSLIYTFSGYNIQYYTNINWLDCVALYPLLIAAMLAMFRGKSKLPYVLIMTYLLTVQTYMSFFVVISLVIFGGIYIFIADEKNQRKKHIYSLGAGTLISLIASSYSIYNFAFNNISSARFEYNMNESISNPVNTYLRIISTIGYKTINSALFMFIGAELAVACLIILVLLSVKKKEHRGYTVFFALSGIMLLMQAYCLATDLLWHGGSRIMFAFRNGYMVAFWACLIIGYFITKALPQLEEVLKSKTWLNIASPCAFIGFALLAVGFSKQYYDNVSKYYDVVLPTAEPKKLYLPFFVFSAFVVFAFAAALVSRFKKTKELVVFILVAALVFANTNAFVGNAQGSPRAEKYNSYFSDCFDIKELFSENDEFQRLRNTDVSLLTNFAYFSDTYSVSNWVNNLNYDQIDSFKKLGFSSTYTRTLDSGSSAFADSLLRITNSVSKAELNPSLYEKTGETESGIKAYKNRFSLPLGIVFDNELKLIEYENYNDTFEYQNKLYESLTGSSGLFREPEITVTESDRFAKADYYEQNGLNSSSTEGDVYSYTLKLKTFKNSTLYFRFNNEKAMFYSLTINGAPVKVYKNAESVMRESNYRYPHDFNNNVLELGSYNGEELEIQLDMTGGSLDNAVFSLMDNSRLEALCASYKENAYSVNKNEIELSVNAKKDGLLFIPVSYSEKWKIELNNSEVEPIKVMGNFIALSVKKGENSIKLKYSDKNAYFRFIYIFIAFGIAAALVYLERKIKRVPNSILNLLDYIYTGMFGIAATLIYILPVLRKLLTK